jgi:hypothetical protein
MGIFVFIAVYVCGFALLFGFFHFLKWFLAGISILTGDKESLHDFGNLCDPTLPPINDAPVNQQWRQWESYKDNWRNRGEGNM